MTAPFSKSSPELCFDVSDDEILVPPMIAMTRASKMGK